MGCMSLYANLCDIQLYTCGNSPHYFVGSVQIFFLRSLMERMKSAQKEEIQARVEAFEFSGFDTKLSYNLCRHFRSFVGRDFKAVAQCALFLLGPYMLPKEKLLWVTLSKVYIIYLYTSGIILFIVGVQYCVLPAFSLQQTGRVPANLSRFC